MFKIFLWACYKFSVIGQGLGVPITHSLEPRVEEEKEKVNEARVSVAC